MTIPNRGVWKNSKLHAVIPQHKLAEKVPGKYTSVPVGIQEPPAKTHSNAHVESARPGLR